MDEQERPDAQEASPHLNSCGHASPCPSRNDIFGLPVTLSPGTDLDAAMESFNTAAEYYVNYSSAPVEALAKALEADPNFFMAHLVQAAFFGRSNLDRRDLSAPSDSSAVTERAADKNLNERERMYCHGYEAWESGDFDVAMRRFEDLARSYPTDVIVLRLLHAMYLMLGQPRRMRDSLMGIAHAWHESMPFYPIFLAMYSFALEECHEYEFAREKASRALRMRPDAVWAMHSLAHCHEERSPAHNAIAFLEGVQDKWQTSILSGHLFWHLSLYYVDVNNMDRALEIFDTQLEERLSSGVIYSLVDAASLLWRMECCGVDVGSKRWQKMIEMFQEHIGKHQMAWFDIHLMYALTHNADPEQASKLLLGKKLLESMDTYMSCHTGHNTDVMKQFGYRTCQGLLSFASGKYEEACESLLAVQPYSLGCGWSTAQRQVFLMQLYHVAKQADDAKVANSALSTLREMKPYSLLVQRLKLI
eukprot:scpid41060/ scgid14657/ Tetratricopeptide repeat protein 38